MTTLSFHILDDSRTVYGPIHISMDVVDVESLTKAVNEIREPFMKYINRKIEYENQSDDEEQKERDALLYFYNPNYKPLRFCEPEKDELVDPTGYFFEKHFDAEEIVSSILYNKYYKLYNYQKYYTVSFEI